MRGRDLATLALTIGVVVTALGCNGDGSSAPPVSNSAPLASPHASSTSTTLGVPDVTVVTYPAGSTPPDSILRTITMHPAFHHARPAVSPAAGCCKGYPCPCPCPCPCGPSASPCADDRDGLLTAAAFQQRYGTNTLTVPNEATQVIAIIDAYGDAVNGNTTDPYGKDSIIQDLARYSEKMGLPPPGKNTLTVAEETDLNTGLSGGDPSGWETETSLDVQMVYAMAPQAEILLVLAGTPNTGDMLTAVDFAANYKDASGHPVTAISMSWGGSEFSQETEFDSHFFHTGVTFLAATGDDGANESPTGGLGIWWPAACPNVVAVGGTSLAVTGNMTFSESAWARGGGGVSLYETPNESPCVTPSPCPPPTASPTFFVFPPEVPSYQAFVQTFPTGKSTPPENARVVPDVSANAGNFPYFLVRGVVQKDIQGTSIATPLWAGMIGLANGISTHGPLNRIHQDLYGLAVGTTSCGAPDYSIAPVGGTTDTYTDNYYDITTGSNGYAAVAGYDYVTGLGSPNGATLIPNLAKGQ